MTPVYDLQNPPPPSDFNPVDQHKDDKFLQLFLSSTTAASSSSSSVSFPTNFFDASQDNYQRMIKVDQDQFHHVPHDHQKKHVHGGSNYNAIQEFSSSSSLLENPATGRSSGLKLYLSKREVREGSRSEQGSPSPSSGKWASSKVKPSCIAGDDQSAKINEINSRSSSSSSSSTNNNVRFCSDCNTTTTPLWRSGPRGPKSLCNACGIRQRKARKAMEAAAAAAATATAGSPSIKIKVVNNKEKKSRSNQRKLCFKDFALSLSKNSALKQVLPQDVEEAAILLMELSCGFIQS